jgi:hypothetical protein
VSKGDIVFGAGTLWGPVLQDAIGEQLHSLAARVEDLTRDNDPILLTLKDLVRAVMVEVDRLEDLEP